MTGWSCEEWMDWAESRTPFALVHTHDWGDRQEEQKVFERMWTRLRSIVQHYMRPASDSDHPSTIETVRKWGVEYAALAEQVRAHHL